MSTKTNYERLVRLLMVEWGKLARMEDWVDPESAVVKLLEMTRADERMKMAQECFAICRKGMGEFPTAGGPG